MASIEGKRGTPRPRPPYPAIKGLWGKPTNINNVETFANVPWIILNGAEKYAAMGTEKSKGTKVFAIAGKAQAHRSGGSPHGPHHQERGLRCLWRHQGRSAVQGGADGRPLRRLHPGLPGGHHHRLRADHQDRRHHGSGGMVVMDDTTCMVEMARFFLTFTQLESCGKCTSCRIGTLRMLEILEEIVAGRGKEEHLAQLEELGQIIKGSSQCGLGQTAPNPVLTTMKYFRDEYEAPHPRAPLPRPLLRRPGEVRGERGQVRGLHLSVPASAPPKCISGEAKKPHLIDESPVHQVREVLHRL